MRSLNLKSLMCVGVAACGSGAAAVGAPPAAPPPASTGPAAAGGWVERTAGPETGGRGYRLYRAAGYGDGTRLPLLVMLHGCTQDAADFAAGTRIATHADRRGFLVVVPEQPATAHPQRCWNWYEPAQQHRGGEEPAAVAALVREVIAGHGVDPARVYVAGISAGGAMSALLAATHPELFAAFASHSGVGLGAAGSLETALAAMRGELAPGASSAETVVGAMGGRARPMPAILVHGLDDGVVAPANLAALEAQWLALNRLAGVELGPAEPVTIQEGARRAVVTRIPSPDGRPWLESWAVEGLGHAWSGGSVDGTFADPAGPDATAAIVRFLLHHSREP